MIKFHQDLVAEEVLEDSTVAITVTCLEPQAKSLLGYLKKAVAALKPKNIT